MAMKKLFPIVATLLVLAISGCAPQVDIEAEEAAIREADRQFSAAAAAKHVEGMVSLFADDAQLLPPDAPAITGKEGVRNFVSEITAIPGFAVSWQTTQAEVSRAGDLGYTLATLELTMNDAEGNPVTRQGKDFHVWKKQPDGSWKVVIDIWNFDQPAASE
jgi:uncharacterized protein (TIGR02246 family)